MEKFLIEELNEAVERGDSKSKPTDKALISLLSFIIYFVFLWCVVIFLPHSSISVLHWLTVSAGAMDFHIHTCSFNPDTFLSEKCAEMVKREGGGLLV